MCNVYDRECTEAECKVCESWRPPYIATDYFAGRLDAERASIISKIYLARQKRGDW